MAYPLVMSRRLFRSHPRTVRRLGVLLLAGAALLLIPPVAGRGGEGPNASVAQLIGLEAARQRLGERMPTGRGVIFGHVEGEPGQYAPNTRDGAFKGVNFILRSGESKVFGHANSTARVIYGPNGLAPGVDTVHLFTTNDYLSRGHLRMLQPAAPTREPIRVFTHSWIAPEHPAGSHILRRVDHLVDQRDLIICAGVNNRRQSAVPQLLSSGYNVIAVGTNDANGASSGGYTRTDTPGRCKPDIVGPKGLTSFTTPAVAACAGILLEAADRMPVMIQHAGRAEVIKAVLMAGAVKPWGWRREKDKPLDERRGAGVVNIDNSLRILQAGPSPPGRIHRDFGWDFHALKPGEHATYTFEIDEVKRPLSVMLVWNRRVDGRIGVVGPTGQPVWDGPARLADFDLALSGVDPEGQARLIQLSRSRIDNVEHIYLPQVSPGRYRLDVVRQRDSQGEPWDYALAWRLGGAFDPDGPTGQ